MTRGPARAGHDVREGGVRANSATRGSGGTDLLEGDTGATRKEVLVNNGREE